MKRKIFFKSLLVAACLLMGWGSTAWAETGTKNATNTGTKDQAITGTSYTIPGTYIAGAGGAQAGDMKNKGVKFRTGSDGARLVFNVNSGYKITGFRLYGISNYDLKSGKSEPCISVTKVEVDGTETTQTGTGQFPAKGSSSSGSVILSGINAESTIAIYFDNSNAGGTQINGYYELDWETVASNVPLSTTISPSSATVYVGYTTTLTGSFTGGDFEGEWVSDNTSVATVNSSTGVVTGVAAGTANITYQWKNDQSQDAYKATAAITVATPEAIGTAGTLALDILQYETINLTNVYSFDSNNQILVVSANQIRANGSTQKWMNYKDAGGAQKTWSATGVFKGSAFYNTGSSNNAVVLHSGKTFTLRVTNSDEISALVLSGGSSKTTITIQMDIYELDAYGIERVSNTPVETKSTTSTSEDVLTASGLDKTKVYEATFTSTHATSNSYVYEVAFKCTDTRTATTLSFPENAYEATLGQAFTAPVLTTTPANLEGVTYSSSNESVATVDANTGAVTLVSAGIATITANFARTDDYKASSAFYTLSVIDPVAVPTATTVTPTIAGITVGQTVTLTGAFEGGIFTGEWVSDNTSVATVNSSTGVVTGVAAGTANITYQWTEDQSEAAYKASAAITVVPAYNKNLYITVKEYNFASMGETTLDLGEVAGTIYNAGNSVNNQVKYCTNDGLENLAVQAAYKDKKGWKIDGTGLLEGSGAGRCAAIAGIRAGDIVEFNHDSGTNFYTKNDKSDDGVRKIALKEESGHHVYYAMEDGMIGFELTKGKHVTSIVIYKEGIPTSLNFASTTANANLGEDFTAPTLTKSPVDLEGVVFSSSNTAVATVNESTGAVTLVAAGSTTITATFEATDTYVGATASYELTVTDPNVIGYSNEAASAIWAFQDGTTLTPETLTPSDAFLSTSVNYGSMTLGNNTAITFKDDPDLTLYTFNTITNSSGSSVSNINVDFVVTPTKGITFKPTSVYFEAARIGHNNGKVTISAIYGDGTTKTLKEEHEVARNNTTGFYVYTTEDIAISDGVESANAFTLRITLNKLDNGKADAFRNVKILGVVNGAPEAVTTYTITAEANDSELGTVAGGALYLKDDVVTLTATPNTGAKFVKWQKEGEDIEGGSTLTFTASEDATYTAVFQKLFKISFVAGEGADKGTTTKVLETVYEETSYTTPAANYYVAKPGYTATGWTDGENDYTFGQTITLTADVELQPIFVANEVSLSDLHASDVVVTYNFNPETGAPALNIENATGYYVQQATINGTKIDMPIYINNVKGSAIEGKTGKTNNVSANATTAQINEGSKFTLAAVKGMTVVLTASNNISTTTVGGATPSSGSGTTTATYTYNGEGETVDIVFGNDGRYYSSIVVTYPKKLPAEVTATISEYGYATFSSAYALDFSGVTKLKAYIATSGTASAITLELVEGTVAANTGLVVKGTTANIPVVESGTDYSSTNKLWVWDSSWGTEVGAASEGYTNYVLSVQSGNVVFAPIGSTPAPIKGGQAVLTLPVPSSDARSLSISFADEQITGISRVENSELRSENSIFDLQGRCVAQPTKGLYIKNGKKVFVK